MSPSAASGKSETVTASWKALTIQIAFSGATANWRAIVGSATVTMVPSSTAMLIAMARVVNASRRCGLGRPSCASTARGAAIGSGRFKAISRPRARGASSRRPPQIVSVGALDLDGHDVARAQWAARRDMHGAVDLRGVALAAALGLARATLVDDGLEALADLGGELLCADRLGALHETLVAACFDLVRHRLSAEIVRRRAFDRLVLERADAIELGFVQPIEQETKILLGLAGKADDESRADGQFRADRAPGAGALQRLFLGRRPPHRLQHRRRSMLKRHIDIGQHIAAVHERDRLVDMRVGVDILQPDPGAERTQFAGDVEKACGALPVAPQALGVSEVKAVSARVLRDDNELLDARLDQPLSLAQHVAGGARGEPSTQARNNAEGATVIAAFGDFEIGVVARREAHAFAGDEIGERIAGRWRGGAHRLHHAFERLRASDCRDVRESVADRAWRGPHATGHDHLAILIHRLADGGERFRLGAVEKAAGVDDDCVRARVAARKLVTFGSQAGENPLAVDERLWAAERDERDTRRGTLFSWDDVGHAGRLPRRVGRGKRSAGAIKAQAQARAAQCRWD